MLFNWFPETFLVSFFPEQSEGKNETKNVKGNPLKSVYPKTFFVYPVLILKFAPYLGLLTIQSLFLL